ncbi:OmpA family protein [Pseudomonas sp. X10]
MTAVSDMHVRVGGDPRGFSEFLVLRDELSKLNHPACPDVDWPKAEQLCLVLFHKNGADLQTAAAFTLARSQCHGFAGMAQGVALIQALVCQWPSLWPRAQGVRLEIMVWLFEHLVPLVRRLGAGAQSLSTLALLDSDLARLDAQLQRWSEEAPVALQVLRQQLAILIQRAQPPQFCADAAPLRLSTGLEPTRLPVFMPGAPRLPQLIVSTRPSTRHLAYRLLILAAIISLTVGAWWLGQKGEEGLANLPWRAKPLPTPIRLDSLTLFDAGSAELKAGSDDALIKALIDIKAQPGWLIVIAGHADITGDPEQNLQLSRARAFAVRDWMQRVGGLPDSCFAVQGHAARQPLTGNDSEPGRAANRRVDIQLVPQAGACGIDAAGSATS